MNSRLNQKSFRNDVPGRNGACRPTYPVVLLAGLFLCFFSASAQTIDWYYTGSGGGQSANGNTSITGTIGQSDAGELSNGNTSLRGGFWSAAEPAFTWLSVNTSANPSAPGAIVTFTIALTPDADIQAPSGAVQFLVDGVPYGAPVPLAGNAASLSTSALSHALHTVAAQYSGDDNFIDSSNQLAGTESINTLPVAPNGTLGATKNTAVSVSLAKLFTRVTDADGDVVALTNLSLTSTQGGSIVLNGATITYTPPTNYAGADTFTYSAVDTLGGLAQGTITVAINDPDAGSGKNLTIQMMSGGNVRLILAGIGGRQYQLQYTDSLSPANWQNLNAPFMMPTIGLTVITDAPGSGSRYYRTKLLP